MALYWRATFIDFDPPGNQRNPNRRSSSTPASSRGTDAQAGSNTVNFDHEKNYVSKLSKRVGFAENEEEVQEEVKEERIEQPAGTPRAMSRSLGALPLLRQALQVDSEDIEDDDDFFGDQTTVTDTIQSLGSLPTFNSLPTMTRHCGESIPTMDSLCSFCSDVGETLDTADGLVRKESEDAPCGQLHEQDTEDQADSTAGMEAEYAPCAPFHEQDTHDQADSTAGMEADYASDGQFHEQEFPDWADMPVGPHVLKWPVGDDVLTWSSGRTVDTRISNNISMYANVPGMPEFAQAPPLAASADCDNLLMGNVNRVCDEERVAFDTMHSVLPVQECFDGGLARPPPCWEDKEAEGAQLGAEWSVRGPEWPSRSPEWPSRNPKLPARSPEWRARGPEWDARSPEWDARSPEWDAVQGPSAAPALAPGQWNVQTAEWEVVQDQPASPGQPLPSTSLSNAVSVAFDHGTTMIVIRRLVRNSGDGLEELATVRRAIKRCRQLGAASFVVFLWLEGSTEASGDLPSELARGTMEELSTLPQPVVGMAAGQLCLWGTQLLAGCDQAISVRGASFSVGANGQVVNVAAENALQIGFVGRLVDDSAGLLQACAALRQQLLRCTPYELHNTKLSMKGMRNYFMEESSAKALGLPSTGGCLGAVPRAAGKARQQQQQQQQQQQLEPRPQLQPGMQPARQPQQGQRTNYSGLNGAQAPAVCPEDMGPITSLMLCNLPCRLTQQQLTRTIEQLGFGGKYDYIHFPASKGSANLGYVFVNFKTPEDAALFSLAFGNYRFADSRSKKVPEARPARIQGRAAMSMQTKRRMVGQCPGVQFV